MSLVSRNSFQPICCKVKTFRKASIVLFACVQVNIGANLTIEVGVLRYSVNIYVVAVPAAVAAVIILIVLVVSIVCCAYVWFKRSTKERDRQLQGLLAQMELMESELAEECRRGAYVMQTAAL